MNKTTGFALGSALLVGGFVWIVFDSLALGLIAGMFAGAGGAKAGAGGAKAGAKRDADS